MKYLFFLLSLIFNRSICISQEKIIPVDSVYEEVEVMPEYPGGMNALLKYMSKIDYPEYAQRFNIEGIVRLSFIVDTAGRVTSIKFDKSSGTKVLDTAAYMHVKRMPEWKPGIIDGRKVKVIYHIPVKFALTGEIKEKYKEITSDKIYNEGIRLFNIGEYKTAIVLFENAFALNKIDFDSKFNAAICKLKLDRIDEACVDYDYIKKSGKIPQIKTMGSEKLIEVFESICNK